MQTLTASPREGLTETQVREALTGDSVDVAAGCDLFNPHTGEWVDISDALVGGDVERNNYADVHGSCRLQLATSLAWGRERVRPWMTLNDIRFNLGVYVLTTPDTRRGEDPQTFDVSGFDLLHLLQDGPGDTYVVEPPTTYLQAVRDVATAAGLTGVPVRLDGTLQLTTVSDTMVWALTEEPVTWLAIVNDLLAALNYRALWVDQDGALRSEPYMHPAERAVEWVFDTVDESTNIVHADRVEHADVWAAPNWWRFVRRNMTTTPTLGAGLYEPAVNAVNATSTALGRIRRKVVFLDAADQATLEAQGDRIVAEDTAITRTFELLIDPLPIAGHFDVVTLRDNGYPTKCQVVSWAISLDGSPARWLLEAVDG